MKRKSQAIRDLLGFSQDDLAMILKVSRNTISRFELGIGGLPLAAKSLMAELLKHMCSPEIVAKMPNDVVLQYSAKAVTVTKLHKENEYQLERISRKVAALKEGYNYSVKALQSLDFLAMHPNKLDPDMLGSIAKRTIITMKEKGLGVLYKLELQLELLQLEKLMLDSELRKMERSPELTGGRE